MSNDRELWLMNRKTGIGGSDVAAILGLSPWRTAVDVYMDKVSPETKEIGSVAMRRGQFLEPLIVELYAEATGNEVWHNKENESWTHPIDTFLKTTPDGVVTHLNGARSVFEAKSAAGRGAQHWFDGVPAFYATQIQHEMYVMGFDSAELAYLINDDFAYLSVSKRDDYADTVVPILHDFWMNHVLPEKFPEPRTIEDYKRVYAQSVAGSTTQASMEMLNALDQLLYYKDLEGRQSVIMKQTKEKISELDLEVRAYMRDFETLLYEDQILLTYKTASNKTRRLSLKEPAIKHAVGMTI